MFSYFLNNFEAWPRILLSDRPEHYSYSCPVIDFGLTGGFTELLFFLQQECLLVASQSISLLLNYIIRLFPLNPRFYGAQTNTSPLKTTAYSYLHTTKISPNSTSIINII
jgi:hypothetical protein